MIGAVMAGGASRRMGRDKAGLLVDGEALWRRQTRILRDAGAERVAVVRRRDQSDLGAPLCLRDRGSDAGPLAGLESALIEARRVAGLESFLAVLAVDMPGIDAAWFRRLRQACRPGRGAVGRHAAACEPLAAIYPLGALEEVSRRLASRVHSLQELAFALAEAGRLAFVSIASSEQGRFASANTPQDLE